MLRSDGCGRLKAGLAVGVMIGSVLVAGCAPIKSMQLSGKTNGEGLVYFLPKQDLVVTLTRAANANDKLSVDAGPAYADEKWRYLLNAEDAPIGGRTAEVAVSVSGLLMSANAKFESKIGDIAVAIAKGVVVPLNAKTAGNASCPSPGAYSIAIDPETYKSPLPFCGFAITVTPRRADPALTGVAVDPEKPRHGYFYRQALPYRIQVCTDTAKGECQLDTVVGSPTNAPTQFIRVSRALFADNDSAITFNNGMLTGYKEEKDSELLGLAGLPAKIIGAYFMAAGEMFKFLKSENASNVDQVDGQLKLALAKARLDACLAAIRINDKASLDALECSK